MEIEALPRRRQLPLHFPGGRRRTPHGKDALRSKSIQPYRRFDGTLHPRIYHGYKALPSECVLQQSSMFTVVHNPKRPQLDSHVIAAVAVHREREDEPGTYISAVSSVFSSFSAFNQARVVEDTNFVHVQIKAVYDSIVAAFNASDYMKFHGCRGIVIMIDKEMEWLVRVLSRFHELVDRAAYDEIKLQQYLRYPELITQLNGLIEGFEATTMLRVQFWPTNKEELGFAYQLVNKAVDLHLTPYDEGIFESWEDDGDFDASDYASDYSIEDEELIDSINALDEDFSYPQPEIVDAGLAMDIGLRAAVDEPELVLPEEDCAGAITKATIASIASLASAAVATVEPSKVEKFLHPTTPDQARESSGNFWLLPEFSFERDDEASSGFLLLPSLMPRPPVSCVNSMLSVQIPLMTNLSMRVEIH